MKKKILALVLAIALVASLCIGLAACNDDERVVDLKAIAKDDIKIGFIALHDENSTYDKNFLDAMEATRVKLELREDQVVYKKIIEENEMCYNAAVDLVEQGCNIIFADSFGHEDYIKKAAYEYPNVRFCHATGVKAASSDYGNFYNAFASIYEGRYLAGVVAGMKLKAMKEADSNVASKIGYVGAFPYEEVKSGYTSFYLGVKSIVEDVTMEVSFTNSWYSPDKEKEHANKLIDRGAVLISQHADSMGAPEACENYKKTPVSPITPVPNVSYNGSTKEKCPNSYLISSRIDWAPYFEYVIECAMNNTKIDYDWTGTLATGSVKLTEYGNVIAEGTEAKVAEVYAALRAGTLNVFDCNNFKVKGKKIESFKVNGVEVVENGVFKESKVRCAPYFGFDIDGIEILK